MALGCASQWREGRRSAHLDVAAPALGRPLERVRDDDLHELARAVGVEGDEADVCAVGEVAKCDDAQATCSVSLGTVEKVTEVAMPKTPPPEPRSA